MGGPRKNDEFRVHMTPRAETTADIRADYAHALVFHTQRAGDHVAIAVNTLFAGSDDVLVILDIICADAGAWLHLAAGDTGYIEGPVDKRIQFREGVT